MTAADQSHQRSSVLLVEDNEDWAASTIGALSDDYEVTWAATTLAAGRFLEARSFDAIIASRSFQRKYGLTLLEQALGLYPSTAAILVLEPDEFEKPYLNGLDGRVAVLRRSDDAGYMRCWLERQIECARLKVACSGFAQSVNEHNRSLAPLKKAKPAS